MSPTDASADRSTAGGAAAEGAPVVERIDLSGIERMGTLTSMLRKVSKLREPTEVLAVFGPWLAQRQDRDHFLSVSKRNLPEGVFKVTRSMPGRLMERGEVTINQATEQSRLSNPWAEWEHIPEQRGGFLGQMIEGEGPIVVRVEGLDRDPVVAALLGDLARDIRSVSSIPAFDAGEPLNWAIAFHTDEHAFGSTAVEEAMLDLNMIGTATRNLVALKEVKALNSQLEQQFEQIASIQRSLLPKKLPEIPGLSLAASYLTSNVAGGDYYDFFRFPDGRWGVLIADVAGHGAGAATVMAMLRAILHCYESGDPSPAAMLGYANDKLLSANLEGTFVTAFLGIYCPDGGHLRWASGGHNPPRLKRGRDGAVVAVDQVGDVPLGVLPGHVFSESDLVLEPSDTLVLYTDGITESFNPQREMFGIERFDRALLGCSGNPECVVDSLHQALFFHTGVMRRDDDQTIVVLRRAADGISEDVIQNLTEAKG